MWDRRRRDGLVRDIERGGVGCEEKVYQGKGSSPAPRCGIAGDEIVRDISRGVGWGGKRRCIKGREVALPQAVGSQERR